MPYGCFYLASLEGTNFLSKCSDTKAFYIEMMALSVDQIIAKFLQKSFPVIDGEPDYQINNDMWTLIYDNTSNLTTNLGRGNQGHIRLIMWDKLYTKISPTSYDTPVESGVEETFLLQATTSQRLQLRYEYDEARCIHDNHHNMDAALKTMVIDAVNNTYIFALHNVFTGYMWS